MKQNSAPDVAVIIAAYRAETMIARAVASALAQACVAEVIVADDASPDGTVAAATAADDGTGRLKVFSMAQNGGPAAARNAALARASAPIFCVLDADDMMLAGRLDTLRRLALDDTWDMLADDIAIVPEALANQSVEIRGDAAATPLQNIDLETFIRRNISRPGEPRAELGFLKPLIKRSALPNPRQPYAPDMRLGEDYALYLDLLRSGAALQLAAACGYIAFERNTSLSIAHTGADLSRLADVDAQHLAAPDGLTAAMGDALRQHERATRDKADYAHALEVRKSDGLLAGLRAGATRPRSLPYMVAETAREKTRRILERFERAKSATPETLMLTKPRFLIGLGCMTLVVGAADGAASTSQDEQKMTATAPTKSDTPAVEAAR